MTWRNDVVSHPPTNIGLSTRTPVNLQATLKRYDMEVPVFVQKIVLLGLLAAVLNAVYANAIGTGKYPEVHAAEVVIGAPENYIFTGHVYRKIFAKSRLYCGASCLRNSSACYSFNFCRDTKRCELNNATVTDYPEDLKPAEGCSYFDIKSGKKY